MGQNPSFNRSHPNISIYVLHTVVFTFPTVLTREFEWHSWTSYFEIKYVILMIFASRVLL